MKKFFVSTAFLAVFALTASAWADCPASKKASCTKSCTATKVASSCDKPCDSKKTQLASEKKSCDKPCDAKKTQLASDKASCSKTCDKPCGVKAKLASEKKSSCDKPCDKPCDSKKTQLASEKKSCDKPCDKPCDAKKTQLASDKGSCSKTCPATKTRLASTKGDCSKSCGSKCCDMPKMAYKVGDEKTCCPKSAGELAKSHNKSVIYLVGQKEFNDKAEATEAYTKALNDYLANMTTVRYMVDGQCVTCPSKAKQLASKNGGKVKYCVAAHTFDCKEKAEHVAKAAEQAIKKVSMKMVVDGKEYCCSKMAKVASKKSGKSCEYRVGDCDTKCKATAEMEYAKARINAAMEAIEKAEQA